MAKKFGETLHPYLVKIGDFLENKLGPTITTILNLLANFEKMSEGNIGKALAAPDAASAWSNLVDFGFGKGNFEESDKQVKGYKLNGKFVPRADDALITKTGEVIKFNPQDNILATKSSISKTSQGAVATAGKQSMAEQQIIITPAPIYLDSMKIGEALFRASRR